MKKYIIKLSTKEREQLQSITRKGKEGARVIKRAHALLESSTGIKDEDIGSKHSMNSRTVQRIRQRFCEDGLDRALYDAPRSGTPPVLNDQQEAYLVAVACSDAPEGHTHWTVELLRKKLIADKVVSSVSEGTVHARLTERGIKPWREKNVVHSEYQ